MNTLEAGLAEGELCNRNGCFGKVFEHPAENCSCHVSAPCSACTDPRGYCESCGWEESEDDIEIPETNSTPVFKPYKAKTLKDLDSTKVDWISRLHTGSSMIKEGVYPEGMTQEQVKKKVDGTFGGRFDYFYRGRFKFIAYTD